MIIVVGAAVAHGLARWRGLPTIPLMLAVGLAIGASGVLGPGADLQDTLLLGLTFLLFVVGAELDPAAVARRARAAILLGVVQFVFIGGLGVLAARLLDFPPRTAAFIGLAVASSSTLVVVQLLRRREQIFEETGRLAIAVVLVQDLLVILLLPVVGADDGAGMLRGLGATVLLLGLALGLAFLVMPRVIPRLEFDEEPLLLLVLAILFAFAGFAAWLGLPPVIGAFFAGLTLSRFPVNALVRGPVASLSDFFLALFFVALGATVEFGDLRQLLLDAVLLAAMLLLAPIMLVPFVRRAGLTARSSIEVAGLLAQCGELGIMVMLVGLSRGMVGQAAFDTVTLVAVATMLIAPALSSDAATWRLMRRIVPARRDPHLGAVDGHVLFLGCGSSTRRLIGQLRAEGREVVAVDDDEAVVAALREDGVRVVRGDGADPHLLRRLGVRRAAVIVSTMRRRADQERLLRVAGDVPVVVRTFDSEGVGELASRGAIVISESDAAAERFLDWFEASGGGRTSGIGADPTAAG
jgi:Kef-type K+ transport system membrane component KefB